MDRSEKIVFVTVGSTRFDALIERIFSEDIIRRLKASGFERMVVQTGNSIVPLDDKIKKGDDGISQGELYGLRLETWPFKPTLKEEYERAALVIGHAGSGTITEVLRLARKMIAVPNETLLHNHQAELAKALETSGYLVSSRVQDLDKAISKAISTNFEKFPEYDGSTFTSLLDEEMGFGTTLLNRGGAMK